VDNLDIDFYGRPFFTEDPLDFSATNVLFNYTRAPTGWVFEILCHYPSARLTGEIYFKNHTIISNVK